MSGVCGVLPSLACIGAGENNTGTPPKSCTIVCIMRSVLACIFHEVESLTTDVKKSSSRLGPAAEEPLDGATGGAPVEDVGVWNKPEKSCEE